MDAQPSPQQRPMKQRPPSAHVSRLSRDRSTGETPRSIRAGSRRSSWAAHCWKSVAPATMAEIARVNSIFVIFQRARMVESTLASLPERSGGAPYLPCPPGHGRCCGTYLVFTPWRGRSCGQIACFDWSPSRVRLCPGSMFHASKLTWV